MFLRPSFHVLRRENRTAEVVASQWELAMWMVAGWATTFDGHVTCRNGDVSVLCPVCRRSIPSASAVVEGSTSVKCSDAWCMGADKDIPLVCDIAPTNFTQGVNAARRVAGGVRGYPMLLGIPAAMQCPVLHCTGVIAKKSTHFVLACLPEEVAVAAKLAIQVVLSKISTEAMFLREFRELIAMLVACPSLLSEDLDPVFMLLLQLVQLLNASWRAALTDESPEERSGAAATMQLAASLLGPLYEEIKPLDPVTKDANVFNLYLHAPIAHVRHQVGNNRSSVAYVSDDCMEGHIRGVGRYLYNRGGCGSQAEVLADLAGVQDAMLNFRTPRSHPSALVFTKVVRVCQCWKRLGRTGPADFATIANLARDDAELKLDDHEDGQELFITLPLHDVVDENGQRRRNDDGSPVLGKKEALRRGLRQRQKVVVACFCGKLTGVAESPIIQLLARRRVSKARADALTKAQSGEGATGAAEGRAARGSNRSTASTGTGGMAISEASSFSVGGTAERGGGVESSASERSGLQPKVSSSKARRDAIGLSMPSHLPPCWLLALVFTNSVVYDTIEGRNVPGGEEEVGSLRARANLVRQHIAVLRLFNMRTRSHAFAHWAARSALSWRDVVNGTSAIVTRLERVLQDLDPVVLPAGSPLMM